MHVPLTPLRFLGRAERVYGDAEAIVCGEDRYTYAAYATRVRAFAQALRGTLGVQKGARVLYLGLNCHRLLELYYAVPLVEAILVPVNIRLSPAEVHTILLDSDPDVVVVSPELLAMLPALTQMGLPQRIRWVLTQRRLTLTPGEVPLPPGFVEYDTLVADALTAGVDPDAPLALPPDADEEAIAEIFYTSGTTAQPRGVMLSHRALYLHALSTALAVGVTESDRMVVGTVPLFHVNAWGIPQFMVAVAGVQIVVPRFDPALFCTVVEREKATQGVLVPSMLAALLEYPGLHSHDLSSLKELVLGGAPPVEPLIRRAQSELGVRCRVGYGLTETCPVVTVSNVKRTLAQRSEDEKLRHTMLTGLPVIGTDVRVVGPDGHEVAHDGREIGEILVRGDAVMEGYWHRPEETAAAMRDGYFATGDLAVVDADGYLNIVDRKKDIIISGGENIASVEVEEALYTHPAVLEAAVVARPDPRWGEVPVAFVALRAGAHATPEELAAHVRDRIAHFKVPQTIFLRESLPKTGTGKIMKAALRSELQKERADA